MFKLVRPLSITAGALILFELWTWIDMSSAEYRAGDIGGGRLTAGWFVLGSPFLLGFGLLISLPFSLISRRFRPVVGWLCLLTVFVPLIVFAFVSTTPVARLRKALAVNLPNKTQIQRLEQFDSFGDGSTISGVCSAEPDLIQKLIAAHSLKPSSSGSTLRHFMQNDDPISEDATIFASDQLEVYYDADRSLLCFSRFQRRR